MDLVAQVEALRADAIRAAAHLHLGRCAQLGAEVDLDAGEDEVGETAEDADPRLLEVRRVDRVVDVAERVAVAEAHALPVDERELAHRIPCHGVRRGHQAGTACRYLS